MLIILHFKRLSKLLCLPSAEATAAATAAAASGVSSAVAATMAVSAVASGSITLVRSPMSAASSVELLTAWAAMRFRDVSVCNLRPKLGQPTLQSALDS